MSEMASGNDEAASGAAASRRGLHVAIWLTAALTLVGAVTVAQIRRTDTGMAIEQRLLAVGAHDPGEIAQAYLAEARGLDGANLASLAREYVIASNPNAIENAWKHILRLREDEAGRLGVPLLRAGAETYKAPNLLDRVGWQYYRGRYVERDFDEAMRFLSDPRLRYRSGAMFRLGRVLLDERNPKRDAAAGIALIRAAAGRGNREATAWLARPDQREAVTAGD